MKDLKKQIILILNNYKRVVFASIGLIFFIVILLQPLPGTDYNKSSNKNISEESVVENEVENPSSFKEDVEDEQLTQTQNSTVVTEEISITNNIVEEVVTPVQISGISELDVVNTQTVITTTNESTVEGIISSTNLEEVIKNSIYVSSETDLYEDIINQILNGKQTISYYYPGNYESNAFVKLHTYESMQNPIKDKEYILWMLSNAEQRTKLYTGNNISFSIIEYTISYKVTPDMEAQVDGIVNQIIATSNSGTTVEKIKKVYDLVMNKVTYDDTLKNHTVFDALVKGSAVCDAYSLSIYRILNEMGINCKFVASTDHAWNIVQIDGLWYNLDATWDDHDSGDYTYYWFLKSNADFIDHPRIEAYTYPEYEMSPISYIVN